MKEHSEDLKLILSSRDELLQTAEVDKESIKQEVESLQERYNALENDVEEGLKENSRFDKAIAEVAKIKAMQSKLCGDVGRKLDLMESIGDNVEKVKAHVEEIEVFLNISAILKFL